MTLPSLAILFVCIGAALCPAMCSSPWLAQAPAAELPGHHDAPGSCADHACFCSGATLAPERPAGAQAEELSCGILLPVFEDESAPDLEWCAAPVSVASFPPPSDRVFPLLI